MSAEPRFVDIHCHLVPGIDDGAKSWDESMAMAEIAVQDGIATTIVTPHQLGSYAHNDGAAIRQLTTRLQETLDRHDIPLQVLPGADVRIEEGMVDLLRRGEVVSLADRRRHVLLELPHELYFPLNGVLERLAACEMVGILSHPERNQGLLKQRELVHDLVEHEGCLMQLTAGSLMGTFGPQAQQMSEWMIEEGLVHFVATDAHGSQSRRPLMQRAFERVAALADEATALDVCCHNPDAVASGREVVAGRRPVRKRSFGKRSFAGWFPWRKAG